MEKINNESRKPMSIEIIRYGVVGTLSFLIDYIIYNLLSHRINYLIANIISFIISFIFNFETGRTWVFNKKEKITFKEFFEVLSIAILGLLLTEILLYIQIDIFNIDLRLSKAISAVIVAIFNFLARKLIVYKVKNTNH